MRPIALLLLTCLPTTLSLAADLDRVADWTWTPREVGQRQLSPVKGVGDLDGDGFEEVATVFLETTDDDVLTFHVLVFRGGPNGPATQPSWSYETDGGGDFVGGDFNGDGYGDLAVLRVRNPDAPAFVDVFHGGPRFLPVVPQDAPFSTSESYAFGREMAAGDFNGDGVDDLAIGDAVRPVDDGEDVDEALTGAVFVYEGEAGIGVPNIPDITLRPVLANSQFGSSLAAFDGNGDGLDDLAVGAPTASQVELSEGWVGVYRGHPSGLRTSPSAGMRGGQRGEGLGDHLVAAGDVNGDGLGDLLVESASYVDGLYYEGRYWLLVGNGSGLDTRPVWYTDGDSRDELYGFPLMTAAALGDIDGDGFDDVAIGRAAWTQTQWDQGQVSIFRGGADGPSPHPSATRLGHVRSGFFGSGLATADVNGDGAGDLFVVELGVDSVGTDEDGVEGMLHSFFGTPVLSGGSDGDPSLYEGFEPEVLDGEGDIGGGDLSDLVATSGGGAFSFPESLPEADGLEAPATEAGGGCSSTATPAAPLFAGLAGLLVLGLRRRQ